MVEGTEQFSLTEKLDVMEAKDRYPNGYFLYMYAPGTEDVDRIHRSIQHALPQRLVVLVPQMNFFPTDMGMQVGEKLYGYSIHASILETGLETRLNAHDWSAVYPDIISGGDQNPEGGTIVPLFGLDTVLARPMLPKVKQNFDNAGIAVLELDGLVEYIETEKAKEKNNGVPRDEIFHFGHIDLYFTGGFDRRDQTVALFVDEDMVHLFQNEKLQKTLGKVKIIPVSHQLVVQGGLNVQFVDDVALILSKELVGDQLMEYLISNCREVVELGQNQYRLRGAVKCRSFAGSWKKPDEVSLAE